MEQKSKNTSPPRANWLRWISVVLLIGVCTFFPDHECLARSFGGSSQRRFSFSFSPLYALSSISSTDLTQGGVLNLTSKTYAGLDSTFYFQLNSSLRLFTQIKLASVTYEPLSGSTKKLDKDSNFFTSFLAGTGIRLSSRLNWNWFGGLEKEVFLLSASTLTVSQEATFIPTLGTELTWDLANTGQFGLKLGGIFEFKQSAKSANYTARSGTAFGGKIALMKYSANLEKFGLILKCLYRNQGTTAASQTETSFQLAGLISF